MKTFNVCLNDNEVTDESNSEVLELTDNFISRNDRGLFFLNSINLDSTPEAWLIFLPITTSEGINLASSEKMNSAINDFDISAWRLRNDTSENVSGTLTADDSLTRGSAKAQLIGGNSTISPSNSSADNSSAALEEKMLLNKLAQGDRQAFWQLWELYRDYLDYRCRVWMGKNYFDVKDVMSQAALKAWEKLPNYARDITNLKGWLNRLVHNLCIDIHRQHACRAVGVENIDDIRLIHQERETCHSDRPDSALLEQELKLYLRHCIVTLPLRLREPLILRYYQEMSCADIARRLSISQNNVSKRLQQAKQILKKQLCKYFSGLNVVASDEAQFQQLEQKDFQVATPIDSTIVEINYGITSSCLETLPLWYNFHSVQSWI